MSHHKKSFCKSITASALLVILFNVTPVRADYMEVAPENQVFNASIVEDVGGSERINFSGKLRMLSQRIPASSCNLKAGVAPFKSAAILRDDAAEFSGILDALEFGNPSMGVIGAETNRKTLRALKNVKAMWGPLAEQVAKLTDDGDTSKAEGFVAAQNMPLLDAARLLVSQVSGQYSNPSSLLLADALRIDIAGRQRMLTQKISKEACHILSDINAADASGAIGGTIHLFEVSLQALRFGMPDAGIKASAEPVINQGLAVVALNWAVVRPLLQTVQDGGRLDLNARAVLFQGLNTAMENMNKVVGMYSSASKSGL